MSGINEIKKKAKLSIDEMYEIQLTGNPESRKSNKEEIHQNSLLDLQPSTILSEGKLSQEDSNRSIHSDIRASVKKEIQEEVNSNFHQNIQSTQNVPVPETQTSGKPETQNVGIKEIHQTNQNLVIQKMQYTQKEPTFKMTFALSEKAYKAFNDLYANRILQGRKTDKSELISEAIQWIVLMETK